MTYSDLPTPLVEQLKANAEAFRDENTRLIAEQLPCSMADAVTIEREFLRIVERY